MWKIRSLLNNVGLRKKMVLSYFILTALPLLLVAYLAYDRSSSVMESNTLRIAEQAMEQASLSVSASLDRILYASHMLGFDRNVQDLLSPEFVYLPKSRQRHILDTVRETTYSVLLLDPNLAGIRLYVKNSNGYTDPTSQIYSYDRLPSDNRIPADNDIVGRISWNLVPKDAGYADENCLSAARVVKDIGNSWDTLGILMVDLRLSALDIDKIGSQVLEPGMLWLYGPDGVQVFGEKAHSLPLDSEEIQNSLNTGLWTDININGEHYLARTQDTGGQGWTIVCLLPMQVILQDSNLLSGYLIALGLTVSAISFMTAYFVAKSMTRRIQTLTEAIEQTKHGDFDLTVLVEGNDEIGLLQRTFSDMSNRIRALMNEQYLLGAELKNSEIKAMQAQINPHFLYNTLQLIGWKTAENDTANIAELLDSLSRFYRFSLKKGNLLSTIAEEIQLVENYLKIQNIRFNNAFMLEVESDEKYLHLPVLKMILQPLVENAVLHGILEKPELRGVIMIHVSPDESGDGILISVSDDGVGINPVRVDELITSIENEDGRFFGLENVHRRLRMYYGADCGVKLYSEPGIGTTAVLRFATDRRNP